MNESASYSLQIQVYIYLYLSIVTAKFVQKVTSQRCYYYFCPAKKAPELYSDAFYSHIIVFRF